MNKSMFDVRFLKKKRKEGTRLKEISYICGVKAAMLP